MKKIVGLAFTLIIAALILTACSLQPEATPTQAPTQPPSEPEPEPSAPPSISGNFHIRIELICTTDWANLQIVNHEHVLSTGIVSVSGDPTKYEATRGGIGLGQTINSSMEGGQVGIIVDYELAAQAGEEDLAFLLEKGNLNGCTVMVYHLVGGDYQLVYEAEHQGVVGGEGLNPFEFVLDLNSMTPVAVVGPPDRCDYFKGLDFSIVVLSILPEDTSVTLYTKFPEDVIGLGDGLDDGMAWDYYATLGGIDSIECYTYKDQLYRGRLYCGFPMPKRFQDTSQPFAQMVNGCDEPIYEIPYLSLLVEWPEVVSAPVCGPVPDLICGDEFKNWCTCTGGQYLCLPPPFGASCYKPKK